MGLAYRGLTHCDRCGSPLKDNEFVTCKACREEEQKKELNKNISETDEIYELELLKKIKDIEGALKYYINRNKELEIENKVYKEMYEHRVNEYIKKIKQGEK